MSMKKIYRCNICQDEKKPEELSGFNFSNLNDFTIDIAASTNGIHVCISCLNKIVKQWKIED